MSPTHNTPFTWAGQQGTACNVSNECGLLLFWFCKLSTLLLKEICEADFKDRTDLRRLSGVTTEILADVLVLPPVSLRYGRVIGETKHETAPFYIG